jgi:CubicO group peptidase (beta-lactamase class C family)
VKIVTVVALLLGVIGLPLHATEGQASMEAKVPVATARPGFTPSQAKEFRDRYSYEQVISAGDVSLFHFLNLGIWLPTAIVSRQGNVVDLATAIDPQIGHTRIANTTGGVELSDYLRSTASRAQGMVVVRKGRIVFEEYPGMRPSDSHVWMSVAKTTASLIVRLLAEEGKINVEMPIDSYMSALRGLYIDIDMGQLHER